MCVCVMCIDTGRCSIYMGTMSAWRLNGMNEKETRSIAVDVVKCT